ncbi:lipid-A-disaccharide synthase [Sedimenticola selenatireducens]|uniref:Lipid-A-disaccharide synthase n=1 Tax=Sedimenticola selenatireducens TaxID=191960 RepID=A0A558DV89_9GAMM|nr:lipid-A-disaccharide synthase [Sedimenticola selenatireducens]TVO77655.1 lipid-A-disaccharide synthase [Sedimenticola selenatireducens]TVT64961.1 MAG: lipid-A-disaccharide synthase [Sedimenticola selenatireducens]
MLKIGIVANEPSGDLLGAGVIREIRERFPDAQFEGIGGPLMIAQGCRSFYPMEKLSVMGLVEVLKHLPELLSIRKRLISHFTQNPPDVFIGVDAPDFNLGLESALKKHQIPTVHYVSPTVWAWRPKRVKKIRAAVDLMLSIFPFEAEFLKRHQIPVAYVGHPLADEIPLENDRMAARESMMVSSKPHVIAILPGSRLGEIQALSEVFIKTALLLEQRYPDIHFVVPMINQRTHDAFEAILNRVAPDLPVTLVEGQARGAMLAADVVLTASGTATLEAMLLKRAMVVAYKLNALTYWIVKRFNLVKIPYVAMANLLADEPLAPEFIQDAATPAALADAVSNLMESPERVRYIEQRYYQLHESLQQDSSRKVADAVLNLIGVVEDA